jgi:hypothetical protein
LAKFHLAKYKPKKLLKSEGFSHGRFSRANLTIFGIVFAAIGGYIIYSSFAATPTPTTANLWMDTNGGTCTRSATPVAYNDAQACSSFDVANDKCASGDTVLVKAGAYPYQDVTGSNSRTSACTIQAASGETVTVRSMLVEAGANWLTFKDMADHTGDTVHASTDCSIMAICVIGNNITLDNFDITGPYASINIDGTTNGVWTNSDFGTPGNTTSVTCAGDQPGAPMTMANDTNVTVSYINFWPFEGNTPGCGTHLEDVRIWDTSDGVTFLGNVFHGGGADSAYVSSSWGGCPAPACPQNKNIHFVNNAFLPRDPGLQSSDVIYGDNASCNGFVFAYNIFTNGVGNFCNTESNSKFIGNLAANSTGGCVLGGTGAVNTGNVFIGATSGCAGNTFLGGTSASRSLFKLAADGYHLATGSPAINAGENTYCTQYANNVDIDLGVRSGVCDAGPDEFGAVGSGDSTPPTASLTAPANGATVSGTVTVSANAADDVGVAGVQFKLDGNNLSAEDTSSPYSISWDATAATNGSHTLTAVARDAAGNTTASTAVNVTVTGGITPDTTPPAVSLTAPANGATVSGSSVSVAANASDNIGVIGVQFKLDGSSLGSEDTTSPYGVTWNATQVSNGSHTLTAVARDAAGNTTTSTSITVTVTGGSSTVLGNQTVETLADGLTAGQTEAWPFTASASGPAASASIYLDASSTAQGVLVGIYADNSGAPGALLATATISSPVAGWNSANFSANPNITAGTNYWLAVLGTGTGTVVVRDRGTGGTCSARVNATPNTWTSLHNPFGSLDPTLFAQCPVSAYVTAGGAVANKIGDINSDGSVNIFDLSIMLSNYNGTTASCDLNSDGTVNIFDLSILLSHYGS